MQSMPSIPRLEPVTTRPGKLDVDTRIEMGASIVACLLHDWYETQHDLPHRHYSTIDRETQRIYEALGRQVVSCILKPSRVIEAKRKAVEDAVMIMGHYDEVDVDDQRPVPLDVRRKRIESAVLSAIHRYHVELAREVGR